MPPKKLRNDWSWIDQVKSARDITDNHRLAAAGLADVVPCTYAFPILDGDETPMKDKRCKKNYCETNPACYNHLGVTDLLNPRGKGKYVESKLSKRAEKRKEGIPAGLRNLGATCYVRLALFITCDFGLISGKRIPPAMVPQHPLPKCDIRMRPYPRFPFIPHSTYLWVTSIYREAIHRPDGAY